MLVYLSIPYSHPLPEVRAGRMKMFWRAAAYLLRQGRLVVSPMTLEPALQADPTLPYDWGYWQEYSLVMLGKCGALVVLTLDGWQNSEGVKGEIAEAQRLGLAVEYLPASKLPEVTGMFSGRDIQ
jgi:hypothetical protein